MRGVARSFIPLIAGAVLGIAGCGSEHSAHDDSAPSAAERDQGSGAKVTAISGPGGITSPSLAEGTFVGAGGHFEAGATLATAKGTLAELELDRGGHLYLHEDTRLHLPGGDHPSATRLERGELVITTSEDTGDVIVAAERDTLTVERGEAQIRADGDRHRFAVVHGRARLRTGDRDIVLNAGDTIETPLTADAIANVQPTRSLAPLQDTGWARAFDAAVAIADSVPRGVGSLTARRAGSNAERQALRLTEHRVTVNISGRVAHTEVEQAFFNDRGAVLEGIYRFPIPGDGSISGLSLLVGNTWMDGEIVEKQRARRIFNQIVDATVPRDPALLEWERGNVFKLRIFPIPGRGERRVKLSYTQVLPVVGDKLRYRYPLGGSGATGTPIDNFAFTVRLDGREVPAEQLDAINTPMLALERRDRGDLIELHTEREAFLPTYDLGLDVPVPAETRSVQTRTFRDKDGQVYFMAAMEPQFDIGTDARPVHYAFVLDRSHSTSPELWTTARGVVDAMTELMDADDRFTVLACDTACDEHADGLSLPTRDVVGRAQQFLDRQDLAGASDLAGAMQHAAKVLERTAEDAQHVVVYLGDGVPTSGEMAPDGITSLLRQSMGTSRVLALALGSRSDLTTLQSVVDVTGGDLVQADARDDLRALVRELRLRAEVPALREASIDLPEGMMMARMNNVSAIRPGDTVVVTGKLDGSVRGDIVLRGQGPQGPVETRFPIDLSPTNTSRAPVDAHLPRTWASMQIAHLTKTQGHRAKADIIALSKAYTVLSRHTALLVLENDAMFREFNVVRAAKNTERWSGELGASRQQQEVAEEEASAETPPADFGRRTRTTPIEPSAKPKGSNDGGSRDTDVISGVVSDAPKAEPKADPSSVLEQRTESDDFDDALDELLNGTGRGGGGHAPPSSSSQPSLPESEPEDVIGGLLDPEQGPSRPKEKASPKKAPKRKTSGRRTTKKSAGSPWRRRWSGPRIAIRPFPSPRGHDRVRALAASVAADPTNRAAHRRLVRTAMATNHADAPRFARAWAEVDPDHAGALEALADALAVAGDPVAPRAYASVVEVRPFSTRRHAALARAYENDGDFARACSHRRALVSIKPSVAHQAGLIACLQRAGDPVEAARTRDGFISTAVITRGSRTAYTAKLDKATASAAPSVRRRGELRAALSWRGPDDLDIAFVDRRGRRISALNDHGLARASNRPGFETLDLTRIDGPVFVEISRRLHADTRRADEITANLELVTSTGRRRTVPVVIPAGSIRVAKVFWTS